LLEVQQHFGLPSPALVEKDWYVVKALAAIATADVEPFRLVFGGGTALSRAHGLIRRMSEDIDLRIVGIDKPTRGQLRTLRDTITQVLLGAGFAFDPENPEHRKSMYEGRYTIYQLPYSPTAEGQGALRPEIQIEMAVFPLRRASHKRSMASFAAEGFRRPAEVAAIECASIAETAAEKFVALTRRAGAELAGLRKQRDSTLVRHIYDLHVIREQYGEADVAALAREVMVADAELRGKDFPAYRADPVAETLKAVEGIAAGPQFRSDYANFCRDMVYGDDVPDFDTAIGTLKTLAYRVMPPPNIFSLLLSRTHAAVAALAEEGRVPAGLDTSRIVVEPPKDPAHGDMATNAAMVLAKDAGQKPRELAEAIAAELAKDPLVAKVDVAGPGFINLTLTPPAWTGALCAVLAAGKDYGKSDIGKGEAVNVEYVSANPTGPMHVGHCRGAVFGDALANLLAFSGYAVTREYYINDAGAQVEVLARSALLRYREALGETVTIPEGYYPGDYLKEVGAELAAEYGAALNQKPEQEALEIARERAINVIMADIRNDLMRLNVAQDVFFSERSLIEGDPPDPFAPPSAEAAEKPKDMVAETIKWLRERGLVYEGRLPPPKSGAVEDWEDREQTLFRATQFGDDVDRPLMKSDGSYTYFASDIAYHKSKFDRGFRHMIDVWGADHGGYVKRMQAAVKAISQGEADLDVKIVQLVKLLRAGEPVKMSKRAGDFVTLREVVEEVGLDAVRFMMLYRKNDAVLDFDLAKVIEQSRDNPVFYVQYAHARAQSVFRNAREMFPDLPEDAEGRAAMLADAPMEKLTEPEEFALMRRLALYPRTLEAAALAHEPHRVAFYLFDLASEFHALWTRGNTLPHLRFIIQNDREVTKARLSLIQGVAAVLASGLRLLGVAAPDEMR
jgi:arginyl-tRNA synthetase